MTVKIDIKVNESEISGALENVSRMIEEYDLSHLSTEDKKVWVDGFSSAVFHMVEIFSEVVNHDG